MHSDFDKRSPSKGISLNKCGREAYSKVVAPNLKPHEWADEREMPGPGTYTIDDNKFNRTFKKFVFLGKINYDYELRRDASPGPGKYEIKSSLN